MVTQLKQTGEFVQECWVELQRVTWPDWAQLKNATLVVIVFCLLVSLVIWIMDMASRFFIDVIMGIFGA
ncbi:MAG: preprotein translocase subunit SecE [Gemmatimonadales bacterium]|jgi:preprotein translocase SecE subunit|nr:MAG: preprotein translocase subunit SecE [Gemmatimonadales bacterium]